MKVTKRQFLKLGAGGAAALFLGPLLRPASLLAGPVTIPPGYLDSSVHAAWMKLSYNHGRESRPGSRHARDRPGRWPDRGFMEGRREIATSPGHRGPLV